MKTLSRTEELVLLSVAYLKENAYGVSVRKHIMDLTEEDWSIGAIYVPLDRLTKWGFLDALKGEPTAERGGRRKRYYRLTKAGWKALCHTRKINRKFWNDIPQPDFEKE
ncbi:MAG: helix-turn-helix transcriptional regulator [Candidatus Aminicenantes bacterium]|nr:helix-turn-helix transcriptional regulator [Candidatus Aminicenantes bacterium]